MGAVRGRGRWPGLLFVLLAALVGCEAPRLPQAKGPTFARVGWGEFSVFAGLVFLTFVVPMLPSASTDLDGSWYATMGRAWQRGERAGVDLIGPAGPLGYFYAGRYLPGLFWAHWCFEVATRGLGALFYSFAVCRRAGRAELLAASGLAVAASQWSSDAVAMLTVAAVAVLFAEEPARRPWIAAAGFPLLAALGLVKFTWLVAAAAAFGTWLLLPDPGQPVRARLPWAAAAVAAMAGAWVASGQRVADFPAFLRGVSEYSSGYGAAMAVDPPDAILCLAGFSSLALVLGLACRGLDPGSGPGRAAWMLAPVVLVAFKAGTVRGDVGHYYFITFRFLLLCPFLVLAPGWDAARRWLVLAVLLALAGMQVARATSEGGGFEPWLRGARLNLERAVHWVAHPAVDEARLAAAWDGHPERATWPGVRARVGGRSVDVFSFSQGLALLHGLELRHRPVPQNYAALTSYLQRLNEAFFTGQGAPDCVLLDPACLDRRPALWDDGPALREVFGRYRVAAAPPDEPVLLERLPMPTPGRAMRDFASGVGRLGDWIALPGTTGELGVSLELRANLAGAIRGFVLRPARLAIEVAGPGLGLQRALLVPATSRTPLLVSPYLQDLAGIRSWLAGGPVPRPRWFRVVPAGSGSWWEDQFTYRFWDGPGLAPPAVAPGVFAAALPASGPGPAPGDRAGWPWEPASISGPAHHPLVLEGRPGTMLHAPGELVLELPPGPAVVHARFGLRPDAYTEGRTDGVEFRVSTPPAGSGPVLFERFLDPVRRVGDRGIQSVSLLLPSTAPAVLVFSTGPGAAGNTKWDWSWWGDFRFEPGSGDGGAGR